jgi:hypothetical protein
MKMIMPHIPRQSSRSFRGLPALLSAAMLLGASAGAQDLLQNGTFEAPFPGSDATTNWTLVYVDGGPGDFAIAGQSTEASRAGNNDAFGAQFRANNWNFAHAYFKQIVRNNAITNGGYYLLSIQKMQTGFKFSEETDSSGKYKLEGFMAAISGTSSNAVHGWSTNIGPYSMIVTGTASRSIEIQLHFVKRAYSADTADQFKSAQATVWFDDISLVWTNSP